jgi:hypothetical protein
MSTLFQMRFSFDVLSTRLTLCSEHFIRYYVLLCGDRRAHIYSTEVTISFGWRRAQKYTLDCWAYVTLTYEK